MNRREILKEDMAELLARHGELFSLLEGKTILVTGATGLIGQTLSRAVLQNTNGARVLALSRSKEKAEKILGEEKDFDQKRLAFYFSDISKKIQIDEEIDYIVHAAAETSSQAFVHSPIKTIFTSLDGTRNMLELAKEKRVKSFVYLSTMEIYGAPKSDEKITEESEAHLDTMNVRSSYPESKRLCETLCASYASEENIPTKVLRLTQTFGPGVSYDDGRVFAEFARCVLEKRNIVLKTKGETKRNYLYTADAVSAILTVLLKGKDGNAYNAANEKTYCSIYSMASLVAEKIAHGEILVKIEEADTSKLGYAPPLKMNLSTQKLTALGWEPVKDLPEMFSRMIDAF